VLNFQQRIHKIRIISESNPDSTSIQQSYPHFWELFVEFELCRLTLPGYYPKKMLNLC